MTQRAITEKDLKLAQLCRNCKACSRARRNLRDQGEKVSNLYIISQDGL